MYAIINSLSGSVPAEADVALQSILSAHDMHAEIYVTDAANLESDMAALAERSPDSLLVWGGDGTVACALRQDALRNTPILPVPGGTMNLLHNLVHGTFTDWQDCLEKALSQKSIRSIACGKVDNKRFYVGLTLGKLSQLTKPREALRDGNVMEAIEDLLASDALDVESDLEISYCQDHGLEKRFDATAVGALITEATSAEDTSFDVGIIDPESHWDLAKAAFSSMMTDWRQAPDVAFIRTKKFIAYKRDGKPITATLDGEPIELGPHVDVEIEQNAARVWAAR